MSLDLGIKGKTALVVGGSRGVGRAVVIALAREGCRIINLARSDDRLRAVYEETNKADYASYPGDLMESGATEWIAESIERKFGTPDIIYYCIGGSYGDIKQWNASAEDYQRVWQFNLGIAIELNNAFVPYMLEKKWGRVVMTSTDGTKCNSGNVPYTSAKFALEGYVKTVSKQWAKDNVILTAVAPGHVYTPGRFMYSQDEAWTKEYMKHHAPIERWASDEEIAKVVTFLCSEGASYMAGSVVRVDGGSR
jgi:NAD(P)-dependent dehydrogenase (short-subunit alcohol dehydrogenase family)